MRKRLAVMLAAVMAVSLAGCGSTPKESSTEAAGASETQAESVATEGEIPGRRVCEGKIWRPYYPPDFSG